MNILERIDKQKEFVEKTNVILDKLFAWQSNRLLKHQLPSREEVENEWQEFYKLFDQGMKDGIGNDILFAEQVKNAKVFFSFFDDICPEFKKLK